MPFNFSRMRAAATNFRCGKLWEHFERTGDLADLELCVVEMRKAHGLWDPNDEDYAGITHNLGLLLTTRFSRLADSRDLDEAIQCLEKAVDLGKQRRTLKVIWLNNLANAYRLRAHLDRRHPDLDKAIRLHEAVLGNTSSGSLDYQAHQVNLANDLLDLYTWSEDSHDADVLLRANALLQNAVGAKSGVPADVPKALGAYAHNLQELVVRQLAQDKVPDADLLARLTSAFRATVRSGIEYDPATSMLNAVNWGNWAFARKEWAEAVEAFENALRLSNRLFHAQEDRTHKEAWLRETQDIGSRLAYALCELGHSEQAVVELERTLARILSLSLQEARGQHEEVADDPRDATRRRIADAARSQPLVYICCTLHGGVAIVARENATMTLKLPALTEAVLDAQFRYFVGTHDSGERKDWLQALDDISRKFWKIAMREVIAALGGVKNAVLIPVGKLGLLPLHATWDDDPAVPDRRIYACDHLLLTYAPNACTLSGSAGTELDQCQRLLVVEDTSLLGAQWEAASVALGFPESDLLEGNRATRASVLAAIVKYDVIHFCGHAHAEPFAPQQSALALPDGEVLDRTAILRLNLNPVRLAVLSACETGVPGHKLPDEILSIATGFLEAGAKSVVSSDWAVEDIATALLMIRFYHLWRSNHCPASLALSYAQQWLRNSSASEISTVLSDYESDSISEDARQNLLAHFRSKPSTEPPFAHPYYWAAFRWSGAVAFGAH